MKIIHYGGFGKPHQFSHVSKHRSLVHFRSGSICKVVYIKWFDQHVSLSVSKFVSTGDGYHPCVDLRIPYESRRVHSIILTGAEAHPVRQRLRAHKTSLRETYS